MMWIQMIVRRWAIVIAAVFVCVTFAGVVYVASYPVVYSIGVSLNVCDTPWDETWMMSLYSPVLERLDASPVEFVVTRMAHICGEKEMFDTAARISRGELTSKYPGLEQAVE